MDEVAFGRYRLVALIGGGGMGKVYRAHDTVMGRDVAIKVLPPELANEPGYEDRFRREAYTAARLTEPHIVPIYDAGEIEGRLYLVMPIIDGTDVHSVLRRDGPMDPRRAVQVIEQLAAALGAAHQHGLVHRDIKPSNALLTRDDFVYLIDFGIAHNAAASRLTSTGMLVGTMAYMAPERFVDGTADVRADTYSLACVLYECLTGVAPYPGDSVEQQIAGHLSLAPPKPSNRRPALGTGFDDVIAVGMAKNPDQRYQSARELAAAARRALTAAPTPHPGWPPAPPTQPAHRPPPPWGPRRRAKWALITASIVILTAATATTGYLLHRPSATTPQANSTSEPSTTAQKAPTVAPDALDGLLLTPDQINTAMAATGMTVTGPPHPTSPFDDSASVSDKACLSLAGVTEAGAYKGSGWSALRTQRLAEPGNPTVHEMSQAVVSFPSAADAAKFFTASTQLWPSCANRTYAFPQAGKPDQLWTVGEVSNTDGTLRATKTLSGGDQRGTWNWESCQRALTVVNNVAVDVDACSQIQSDAHSDSAVDIAQQIAAKVARP